MNNIFKSKKKGEYIFYWTMVILPLLQFCVFYFYANFNSFALALKQYNVDTLEFEWVGLETFKKAFYNLGIPNGMLQNSFKTSIANYFVGYINLPISLFCCFYIYKKMPGAEFFRVMLFLPGILSGMVMCLLYKMFADNVIPEIILNLTGEQVRGYVSNYSTRFWAVEIYHIILGFGGGVLIYVGTMNRIPESIVESAKLEGITPVREFFSITFPLILPTVATFYMFGFTGIFTAQMNFYTFFGKGSDSMGPIGYRIFCMSITTSDVADVSALGLIFTAIVLPMTLFIRWLINRYDAPEF